VVNFWCGTGRKSLAARKKPFFSRSGKGGQLRPFGGAPLLDLLGPGAEHQRGRLPQSVGERRKQKLQGRGSAPLAIEAGDQEAGPAAAMWRSDPGSRLSR